LKSRAGASFGQVRFHWGSFHVSDPDSSAQAEFILIHGSWHRTTDHPLYGHPHVSRILNGERELTLEQIKDLGKRFNVSPKIFL
jgi:hypothetical protein